MSLKYCRLFFWFRGADHTRPAGPWWYRDFMSEEDRDRFLDDIGAFLFKYAFCRNQDPPFSVDMTNGMIVIKPPDGVEIIEVK